MIKKLYEQFKVWIYWSLKKAALFRDYECIIEPGARIKFVNNLQLGKGIKIAAGALIQCGDKRRDPSRANIIIGDHSYIGPHCVLFGDGLIDIGEHCEFAPGVIITSRGHSFERRDIPMMQQPSIFAKVTVMDDVWIGCNASIMPGVTIGKGAIVGAGAVVTKDVPEYTMVLGVPARVVKERP